MQRRIKDSTKHLRWNHACITWLFREKRLKMLLLLGLISLTFKNGKCLNSEAFNKLAVFALR